MSDHSQLLASAPGSCTDIRQELSTLLGLKLAGSTYNSLWKNLELHHLSLFYNSDAFRKIGLQKAAQKDGLF